VLQPYPPSECRSSVASPLAKIPGYEFESPASCRSARRILLAGQLKLLLRRAQLGLPVGVGSVLRAARVALELEGGD
jgi:hypothetical protein